MNNTGLKLWKLSGESFVKFFFFLKINILTLKFFQFFKKAFEDFSEHLHVTAFPENCEEFSSEAVVPRCSVKKVFLKISPNSQENTCVRVSFLITFLKKRFLYRPFSVNFEKCLITPFFIKYLRWLLVSYVFKSDDFKLIHHYHYQ